MSQRKKGGAHVEGSALKLRVTVTELVTDLPSQHTEGRPSLGRGDSPMMVSR